MGALSPKSFPDCSPRVLSSVSPSPSFSLSSSKSLSKSAQIPRPALDCNPRAPPPRDRPTSRAPAAAQDSPGNRQLNNCAGGNTSPLPRVLPWFHARVTHSVDTWTLHAPCMHLCPHGAALAPLSAAPHCPPCPLPCISGCRPSRQPTTTTFDPRGDGLALRRVCAFDKTRRAFAHPAFATAQAIMPHAQCRAQLAVFDGRLPPITPSTSRVRASTHHAPAVAHLPAADTRCRQAGLLRPV